MTRQETIDHREATIAKLQSGMNERDRQQVALRLSSPKRANPGRYVAQQDNADELALFSAANEPGLI
jgi:hypothetical protein